MGEAGGRARDAGEDEPGAAALGGVAALGAAAAANEPGGAAGERAAGERERIGSERIASERIAGPREWIAGVPVDRVDLAGAVEVVRRVIEGGADGERADGGPTAGATDGARRCRILVVNANKAWLARRDARLREVLAAAELVIPEWAMVWAAGKLGRAGIHHVGGITLMARLLEEAEMAGWTVYLLGARPEVVEVLAERLRRERPALGVVGWHHGYLDGSAGARVRAELASLRPDLLFVAMGSPLQEYWIDGVWDEPGARVALGVGGSFDVLAGLKRDAPGWARGRGLEWLYRLAQDPRRLWRRYLVTNGWFVWSILRERWRAGRGHGAAG